jgi:hypothetical protein
MEKKFREALLKIRKERRDECMPNHEADKIYSIADDALNGVDEKSQMVITFDEKDGKVVYDVSHTNDDKDIVRVTQREIKALLVEIFDGSSDTMKNWLIEDIRSLPENKLFGMYKYVRRYLIAQLDLPDPIKRIQEIEEYLDKNDITLPS